MDNRQARSTGRTIFACGFIFLFFEQFKIGLAMIVIGVLIMMILGKCPHCGKQLLTLDSKAQSCPYCHGRL